MAEISMTYWKFHRQIDVKDSFTYRASHYFRELARDNPSVRPQLQGCGKSVLRPKKEIKKSRCLSVRFSME